MFFKKNNPMHNATYMVVPSPGISTRSKQELSRAKVEEAKQESKEGEQEAKQS
jgi:hypothetical protein